MAESQIAARNPPWMMPAGLQNRSSAPACQTVVPGPDLSTQTIPRVRSQFGGTWMRGPGLEIDIAETVTARTTEVP